MHSTRNRLELVTALVDARMPNSAEQAAMLQVYNQAIALRSDWEKACRSGARSRDLEARLDKLDHVDGIVARHGPPIYDQLAQAEVLEPSPAPRVAVPVQA